MRRIVVCTNVSLDGFMQAPARADEDRRNGFENGGWATPYAAMTQVGYVFANLSSPRDGVTGFALRFAA